jgi:DNA topoisomerase-1
MTEDLAARSERHGLRYVPAAELRIRRRKSGRGFVYLDAKGRTIRDEKVRARIEALVLPPAWTDVRIAEDPKAHLQAVGRDNLGRLQYRYHNDWTTIRDKLKAERLLRFGNALPKIRARLEADLRRRKTDRRYAAAVAGRLIDRALLRSGHSTASLDDGGRGATTLLKTDVQLNGTSVELNFTGKSGKKIRKIVRDPALPARLRKLKRIGKKRLFAFRDENGRCCYLSARDLNNYLREAAGAPVTSKDFRTFAASAQALAKLCEEGCPDSERARKRLIASVMRETSERLANTPAVARSSYVHPLVIQAYEAERLQEAMLKGMTRNGLDKAETALMRFLEVAVGGKGGDPLEAIAEAAQPIEEAQRKALGKSPRPGSRSGRRPRWQRTGASRSRRSSSTSPPA